MDAVAASGAPGRRDAALAALDAMSPAARRAEPIEPLLTVVVPAASQPQGTRRIALPGTAAETMSGEETTRTAAGIVTTWMAGPPN